MCIYWLKFIKIEHKLKVRKLKKHIAEPALTKPLSGILQILQKLIHSNAITAKVSTWEKTSNLPKLTGKDTNKKGY